VEHVTDYVKLESAVFGCLQRRKLKSNFTKTGNMIQNLLLYTPCLMFIVYFVFNQTSTLHSIFHTPCHAL